MGIYLNTCISVTYITRLNIWVKMSSVFYEVTAQMLTRVCAMNQCPWRCMCLLAAWWKCDGESAPAGGMVEGVGIGAPLDAAQERRLPQSLTSSFYSRSFCPTVTSSRRGLFSGSRLTCARHFRFRSSAGRYGLYSATVSTKSAHSQAHYCPELSRDAVSGDTFAADLSRRRQK